MPEPTATEPLPVTPAPACDRAMPPEKKKAIKGYIHTLGPKLRENHGVRPSYTPRQVHAAAHDSSLNIDYICFAYMMYCSPAEFTALHAAAGEVCDLAAMRASVADEFFNGNVGFDAVALADGLWGGVVSVAETGASVTIDVIQTGAEVAVNLATTGKDVVVTVVSTGAEVAGTVVTTVADGAGVVVDGVGTVFGWLGDVSWGDLFNVDGS